MTSGRRAVPEGTPVHFQPLPRSYDRGYDCGALRADRAAWNEMRRRGSGLSLAVSEADSLVVACDRVQRTKQT